MTLLNLNSLKVENNSVSQKPIEPKSSSSISVEDVDAISRGIINCATSKSHCSMTIREKFTGNPSSLQKKSDFLQKDLLQLDQFFPEHYPAKSITETIKPLSKAEKDPSHSSQKHPERVRGKSSRIRHSETIERITSRLRSEQVVHELDDLFQPNSFTGKIISNRGPKAMLRYLNNPQKYYLCKISCSWVLPSTIQTNGQLGYHACIHLPGNRICELEKVGDRPWKEIEGRVAENHTYYATGKQIEAMWRTHQKLIPKYREWGNRGQKEGLVNYRFFDNDCFTYVNRVLSENDLPPIPPPMQRTDPHTFADGVRKTFFSSRSALHSSL